MPDLTAPSDDLLATQAGIQTYLQNTAFASHTVDLLSKGAANLTYRIHLHTPVDGKSTFILKYAKAFATITTPTGDTTQIPITTDRQRIDAEAVRLVHSDPRADSDSIVTAPAVYLLDEESHALIMEDTGLDTRTLKELLIDETLPRPLLEDIGAALGRFIGNVHGWNERPDVDLSPFANYEVGKSITFFATYSRLVSTLTGKDDIPYLDPCLDIPEEKLLTITKLVKTRDKEIQSASAVITHGDFWPGNVMVSLRRGTDGAIEALDKLYVMDWELAKTGLPGLDLGQMCAEFHLIAKFHPHRQESANTVIKSFLSAYKTTRGSAMDPGIVRVAVGHIGAHLVAWTPRISWGSREKTRDVVQEGVELLNLSWTGPDSSLLDSIVQPLLSE